MIIILPDSMPSVAEAASASRASSTALSTKQRRPRPRSPRSGPHQEKTADFFIPMKWETCKNWFFFIPKSTFSYPQKYPEICFHTFKFFSYLKNFFPLYKKIHTL
jgi:hypothetical protein